MSLSSVSNLRRPLAVVAMALLGLVLAGCGVNNVPTLEEKAKASWSEVQNQYQRRADLIPNLVETVKGYAAQEREVLTAVVEARAKASQVKVDASTITDPAKFKEYQEAQNQLSGALGRLLVTVRALSRPEIEPELPGAAIPTRRHREPGHGGAARLHPGGPGLQHRNPHLSRRDLGAAVLGRQGDGDLCRDGGSGAAAGCEVLRVFDGSGPCC